MKRTLIVFVKWPQAGAVKTRLAVDLGPDVAAAVYRSLAEAEIAATQPEKGEYARIFFYAPAEAQDAVAAWLPGAALLPQEGGDLGARMNAAFERAFSDGADQVAIVGTDVPRLGRATVLRAFDALSEADVAIGPCADGGYYLLGLGAPRRELFVDVAWGTPAVFETTRDRARCLGLRSAILETLPDVDTLADIRRAWDEIRPLLPPEIAARLEPRLR